MKFLRTESVRIRRFKAEISDLYGYKWKVLYCDDYDINYDDRIAILYDERGKVISTVFYENCILSITDTTLLY